MFRNVLVAIDGSAASTRALEVAVELAADQKAALSIVHVIDDFAAMPMYDGSFVPANYMESMVEGLKESGARILDKAGKVASRRDVAPRSVMVETGGQSVAQAILAQARKLRADVIVLGTHGRRGLSRLLLGSDAEMVLREAPCPVLLVRAPDTQPQASKAAAKAPARAASGRKSAAKAPPASKGRTTRGG